MSKAYKIAKLQRSIRLTASTPAVVSAPIVIAMDDWLIFAKGPNGEYLLAISECWPEWLDFSSAPEDMSDTEFKAATLKILRTKPVHWVDYGGWLFDADKAYYSTHPGEILNDAARAFAEIEAMAKDQATFIDTHR